MAQNNQGEISELNTSDQSASHINKHELELLSINFKGSRQQTIKNQDDLERFNRIKDKLDCLVDNHLNYYQQLIDEKESAKQKQVMLKSSQIENPKFLKDNIDQLIKSKSLHLFNISNPNQALYVILGVGYISSSYLVDRFINLRLLGQTKVVPVITVGLGIIPYVCFMKWRQLDQQEKQFKRFIQMREKSLHTI